MYLSGLNFNSSSYCLELELICDEFQLTFVPLSKLYPSNSRSSVKTRGKHSSAMFGLHLIVSLITAEIIGSFSMSSYAGSRLALEPHTASRSLRTRWTQDVSDTVAATMTLFWLRVVSEPASTTVPRMNFC